MRVSRTLTWLLFVLPLLGSCVVPPDDAALKAGLVEQLKVESPGLVDRVIDAYAEPDKHDRLVIQTDYGAESAILTYAGRICDLSTDGSLLERSVVTSEDLTALWECDTSGSSAASPRMESLRLEEEAEARAREQQRLEEERRRQQEEAFRESLEKRRRGSGSGGGGGSGGSGAGGGSCGPDYYVNSQGSCVLRPTNSNAGGATAICRDGTYSYSQSSRGTCSHHGGVAQWY
jgi:hypothetical protein